DDPDEDGGTDEGGDDPDGELGGTGDDPAEDVGRGEQTGTDDGGEGQQPPVVHPDEEPARVRGDQSDEGDRPRDRGGRTAQGDGTEGGEATGEGHPFAEAGGEVVPEREGVQAPGAEQAQDEADREEGSHLCEGRVAPPAHTADLPGPRAVGDVVAAQDDGTDEGGERRRGRRARESQLERGGA